MMLICFSGMGTSENMRRVSLLILVAIVATVTVSAQTGTSGIYSESLAITRSGLYVLGGWSVANIAAGAYGWAAKDGQAKYFGQMNLFWNVVNLSIAGIGLYGNYNTDISRLLPDEMISEMMKTEKIFLINAGADVVYMGAGLLLRHYSGRSANRHDMLKGYGNAVILQGAFLFVFDLVMYGILHSQRMDGGVAMAHDLTPFSINLLTGPDFQGLRLAISF
jgi:hypothetical protein